MFMKYYLPHGVKIKHLDLKDETITETEVTLIIVPLI